MEFKIEKMVFLNFDKRVSHLIKEQTVNLMEKYDEGEKVAEIL